MSNDSDNTVHLGELDNETAKKVLGQQPSGFGNVAESVPKFTKVTDYTTLTAEYSKIDDNLVVHFFLPDDAGAQGFPADYWISVFPTALDAVARSHFSADRPRLVAKYTEEMNSWWFKAYGYGHLLDPDGFMSKFFEKLDEALSVTLRHLPKTRS
jgi:hypothetical protein